MEVMTIVINKATNHRNFVKCSMIISKPHNHRSKTVLQSRSKTRINCRKAKDRRNVWLNTKVETNKNN